MLAHYTHEQISYRKDVNIQTEMKAKALANTNIL